MHPIYEEDSRTKSSPLPPLRPCSHVTTQSTVTNTRFSNYRVSFVESQKPKRGSYLESLEGRDDSSVETMTSASLYSLLNHKPIKKEPSIADYIFCESSFQSFVEEVKGTWEDATSALDQIVHAFVISDKDIDRMSEQIQLAEKSIDVYVVQAVREIGISRC